MSWFEFNGVRNDELDIIVTETPFRPTWGEDIEYTAIAGRPEYLTQGAGTFPNKDIVISCVAADMSKLSRIYQVYQGIGTLRLSTSPNEVMTVSAYPIAPKSVALTMAEMSISFSCYPFAYLTSDTEYTWTSEHVGGSEYPRINYNFRTRCSAPCQPEIRFKFDSVPLSSDLKIRIYSGGKDLYFIVPAAWAESEIIIDSQLKMIYAVNSSNEKVSLNSGIFSGFEFPEFRGENFGDTSNNAGLFFRAWLKISDSQWDDYTDRISYLHL